MSSKIAINESDNIFFNNNNYHVDLFNKSNVLNLFDESFAIYYINHLDTCIDSTVLVDNLIRPVDYALDSLRVSLNSFGFHEQVIGTPGFHKGNKTAVLLTDDFKSYEIIKGKKLYYELSEGIGCDATGFYTDENDILLSLRKDEVYSKYRNILHRLFKAIQIYDVNTCFAFLFSAIEGMDCITSFNFQIKKVRILSFVVENQNEFDILSQQFYFYSKTVRTKIIHAGRSLYDILPWAKIYALLDDLYLLVVRFCISALQSGATTFSELNEEICKKCAEFTYSSPSSNIAISEMPVTVSGKCDYFAEVYNLSISECFKMGETLFLPANSNNRIKEFYEVYEYGLKLCMINSLNERALKVDEQFPNYYLFSNFNTGDKSFTVWDVDVIVTTLLRGININAPFAIVENQFYWEKQSAGFDIKYSCEFSDIICNTIQRALNYLVLSSKISKNSILPSKVGINTNGIRAAYINPEGSSGIHCLPGRVFGEYIEPIFPYTPSLIGCSKILYSCFFDSQSDEVFSTNRNALNRIAESYYFQDINQILLAIFDALDMLYPTTYDGKKLIKRIATFYCNTQLGKIKLVSYLNDLRENVRNPILHGGKSILDLQLTESYAYEIINEIREIVVKYCETVYLLNVHTFVDLHKEETKRNKSFL